MTLNDAVVRVSRYGRALILALVAVVHATSFAGATSATPGQDKAADFESLQKAAMTFPQAVRVGDLAGRYLLMPNEAQQVLGRVASPAAFTTPDGKVNLLVRRGGILGFGTTQVALPVEFVALLGEHVVLVGLPAAHLAAQHAIIPDGSAVLPADKMIKVGIVGPFH